MSLKTITGGALAQIKAVLGTEITQDQFDAVERIVAQAQIDAVATVSRRYRSVAVCELGADADKAHKLAAMLRGEEAAIVANLASLR